MLYCTNRNAPQTAIHTQCSRSDSKKRTEQRVTAKK